MGCGASSGGGGSRSQRGEGRGRGGREMLPTAKLSFCEKLQVNKAPLRQVYSVSRTSLGEGGFGMVSKATHKVSKMRHAVKFLPKERTDAKDFGNELLICASMDHPNIVKVYDIFEDQRAYYLVMELCAGGELFQMLCDCMRFSEAQAATIMRQVLGGVRYMHAQGVCHRDLKPENFLLHDKVPIEQCIVKIIDFGLSCKFTPGQPMTERQGTLYYIAPEVLSGSYDQACDIWSCGVIMYILLSGYPPFGGNTDEEVIASVRSGNFQFHKEFWSEISEDAKDLIKWQLQFKPKHRCSAKQAMDHIWIKDQAPKATDQPLQAGQLTSMRAFCGQNKLKKAALQVIARELQEDQIQQLKDMFVSLDTNGDGKVTFQELRQGISKLDVPELPANLHEVMQEMDVDGSGSIDYTEFLAAALDNRHYEEEKVCWAAFHNFDRDNSGTISRAELAQVLQSGEVEAMMGTDSVAKILTECDADNDGQIDFEEFMQMMRSC